MKKILLIVIVLFCAKNMAQVKGNKEISEINIETETNYNHLMQSIASRFFYNTSSSHCKLLELQSNNNFTVIEFVIV